MQADKQIYSLPQAASEIGMPQRTLYKLVYEGAIPHQRVSKGRRMMLREQVEATKWVYQLKGLDGLREGLAIEHAA